MNATSPTVGVYFGEKELSTMRKGSLPALAAGLFFGCFSVWAQTNSCDLTGDGLVNAADVQAAINMSLGLAPCTANIAGANVCNVQVVQRVVNASLGAGCLTSTGLHVVALTWTASTSGGVTGYQISRGTSAAGPFTPIGSVGTTTSYTDTTVVSGTTYYYVVASISNSTVGANSTPVSAAVPIP